MILNKMKILRKPINVQCENLEISYRIIDNTSAQSIVIIPGHSDSSYSFEETLNTMNSINSKYNYISFDIAWGESEISVKKYTKELQLEIVSQFLEKIVLNHTDKIHLAGHSMGGEFALMTGLKEKKKEEIDEGYNSYIKSITAICPATYPRGMSQLEDLDFISRLPKFITKFLEPIIANPNYIENIINKEIKKVDGKIINQEQAENICYALKNNNGVERFLEVQKTMHFIKGSEYLKEFKLINKPIQFILGQNDSKILKNVYDFIKYDYPEKEIKLYENCTHFIQYQYPEKLAHEILEFTSKY